MDKKCFYRNHIWMNFDLMSSSINGVPNALGTPKYKTLANVLYFGPVECLKEFISRVRLASKRQVWSTFFFSPKFRVTCQKASLVHFQIVRKSKFGPDSEKNLDQTCPLKTSPSRDSNYSKKASLVQIFLESGPNLPFRTI